MKLLIFAFFLLTGLALAKPSDSFKVIGYYASWGVEETKLSLDQLTHINYSFILPNPDGTLKPLPNPQRLKNLVKLAHQKNVKVGIAVGGWNDGDDSAFETLAASPELRAKFIAELVGLVDQYQLDGVDMDWEYPDAGDSAKNFTALIQELDAVLEPKGKFLSAAVVSYGSKGVEKEVFASLDMLNLMAYDGHDHGLIAQAEKSIAFWTKMGCPKEKLILGLPFYGRSPYTPYRKLLESDPTAHTKDQIDKVRYNGIPTIQAKCQMAQEKCGGVMIWELSQDSDGEKSLLKAIDQAIKKP